MECVCLVVYVCFMFGTSRTLRLFLTRSPNTARMSVDDLSCCADSSVPHSVDLRRRERFCWPGKIKTGGQGEKTFFLRFDRQRKVSQPASHAKQGFS